MAPKRRRLQDLYITGKEVVINDEAMEEPIIVWMQKLNAVESETAARRANAARSRVLVALRDPDSEEYENAYADLIDLARDTLIQIVISDDMVNVTQGAQAEIAAEEKWAKDDYLQGLRDSWMGNGKDDLGLRAVYEDGIEDNPLYADAKKVFKELQRYDTAVQKRIKGESERLELDLSDAPMDNLRHDAVKRNLALRGDGAWITEYRRSCLYFSVRELEPEDHKKLYFEKREEVDELHGLVLDRLYREYDALAVEASEGKALPPTPDSSQPSGQGDEAGTAASSGPADAPA